MMFYKIEVTEKYKGTAWIEANSADEAKDKACAEVETDFHCTYDAVILDVSEVMND
jgi:hypothetical protein